MFEPRPFGKYFLTDLIAVGGMAEIYRAKTFGVDGFEKVLAIKKILSHFSADKDFITMLTDEAKLVVNLSHANIVQVYDLGRVGDDYFISMEHIDGINLKELLQRSNERGEKIPPEISTYIVSEVCKGLDYAHNKKDQNGEPLQIVHRDISPQNILVSYDGGVKIVDFGIAKAAMNMSQTHNGILKGKVTYMSPEQAFGKPIDGRTDLFSLGIVYHELLMGKRLFTGESQMEVLKKIRNTKFDEKSLDAEIHEAFRPILIKSLAYSVKNRYQHAADMQIDLTRLLYSHFSDFSPKKLSRLLQLWFSVSHHKNQEEDAGKHEKETILVTSATKEVELSTPELKESTESEDLFQETIAPHEGYQSDQFDHGEDAVETTEKTEKSEAQARVIVPQKNQTVGKIGRWVGFLFVLFLAVAALVLYRQYGARPENPDVLPHARIVDVVEVGPKEVKPTDVPITPVPELERIPVIHKDTDLVAPTAIRRLRIDRAKMVDAILVQVPVSKKPLEPQKEKIPKEKIPKEKTPITPVTTQPPEIKQPDKKVSGSNVMTLGKLRVDSSPRGASVKVNGQSRGVTPIVVSQLPKNEDLSIHVTKSGYKTWSRTLKLVQDRTEINADLNR